jgi:hypothetical protein
MFQGSLVAGRPYFSQRRRGTDGGPNISVASRGVTMQESPEDG